MSVYRTRKTQTYVIPPTYLPLMISRLITIVQVRLAALRASVAYLEASDINQQAQIMTLMYPMLQSLSNNLPHSLLPAFLSSLTPLASSHPHLFEQHLADLLSFLRSLIIPSVDPGPTPTVARPNPSSGPSFVFPPVSDEKGKGPAAENEKDEEAEEIRKAALELMISLTEAKPSMVKNAEGWVDAIIRCCLEGMGEFPEDETDIWLEADVSSSSLSLIACPGQC